MNSNEVGDMEMHFWKYYSTPGWSNTAPKSLSAFTFLEDLKYYILTYDWLILFGKASQMCSSTSTGDYDPKWPSYFDQIPHITFFENYLF